MKLIVGLGNPGKEYEKTRHNVGFLILDYFSRLEANAEFGEFKAQVTWQEERLTPYQSYSPQLREVLFVKPQSFMNNSGTVVRKLIKEEKIFLGDLLVIHDDLDIPLGSYKLQFGKGPRRHNGVLSVERALRTKDFWRLRVGIENRSKSPVSNGGPLPAQAGASDGEKYVLSNFSDQEWMALEGTVKETIVPIIKDWLLKS